MSSYLCFTLTLSYFYYFILTHWGRVTHICVGNLTIIGPDNGLSPSRRQAIIWTNAGILLIGPCGINFSEILIGIQTVSFKKMHLKMSSAKWRSFGLGLNVLTHWRQDKMVPILSTFSIFFFFKICFILVRILLKFVPKGPIQKKSSLIQIMALHQIADKPLFERIMASVFWRKYASLGLDELCNVYVCFY